MLDCLQDAADAESAKTTYDKAFFGALNVFEVENLLAYRKQFPGQAYQLNQSAIRGHAMKSSDGCLHTLIRNCRLQLGS